ncbi:MAG: hypothetical protein ACQEWV_31375 [Bacillota bacterium]
MGDYTWIETYTVLDKTNEQIIRDLEIQLDFIPYIDLAKKRIQVLVYSLGPNQDSADRFLEFLEEEYEYGEIP